VSVPTSDRAAGQDVRERAGSVHYVIIRDARPDEHALIGELRVAAYRALGLPDGSGYAETLRGFGWDGDCMVLVAADETGSGILGTITLEPFDPASELARDDTEADIRAFAVAPHAQGQGVGRKLLLAVIECAGKRGVRRLRLCTRPDMQAAQHLYATTGFSRTSELDFEPVPGLTLRAYELALPFGSLPTAPAVRCLLPSAGGRTGRTAARGSPITGQLPCRPPARAARSPRSRRAGVRGLAAGKPAGSVRRGIPSPGPGN
jgi:ribosomal protein S18 acetylase RimI-like enzyme